jgi:hypothetical protein
MRTADEHTKLARLSLDFSTRLDHLFKLNISKASVSLPIEAKRQLGDYVQQVARAADAKYRGTVGRPTPGRPSSPQPRVDRRSAPRIRSALEQAAANAGEDGALLRIVRSLKEIDPEVCRELGW